MPVTARYDQEADALYVRLQAGERKRTVEIDDVTYVDVNDEGRPIGIELLYPSMGVNLEGVARAFGFRAELGPIATAIAETGAPVPVPTYTGGTRLASTTMTTLAVEGTIAADHGDTTSGAAPAVAHDQPLIQVG